MAQGTTIVEMLDNLAASKAAIVDALKSKGVTVPDDAKFEDIAELVEQVEGGTDVPVYLPAWEYDRTTMTQLVIPDGVTKIGNYAFYYCNKLTSLTIPSSVTSIGQSAFNGCSKLTSLVIPSSVTSIGTSAFSGCYEITSLIIPSSITIIGSNSFSGCNKLTSLTIPSSVTSILRYAFSDCNAITSLAIPSSVTIIEDGAFYYCKSLTSLTIPSSVTSIGVAAFAYCMMLTSLSIPSSITSIEDDVFSNCKSLTSLNIPSSVTSIGQYAFYNCNLLKSLFIPSTVVSIGASAFYQCPTTCNIQFNKTTSEVSSMTNCPWGISIGTLIHCTNGDLKVTSSTTVEEFMPEPTMERVVDLTTTQDNVITSEGDFWVLGTGLTWDTTEDDEGFFISTDYSSVERCNGIESVQNPTCAALHNPLFFDQAGDTITLVFRFRHGSTLKQLEFTGTILTAI